MRNNFRHTTLASKRRTRPTYISYDYLSCDRLHYFTCLYETYNIMSGEQYDADLEILMIILLMQEGFQYMNAVIECLLDGKSSFPKKEESVDSIY